MKVVYSLLLIALAGCTSSGEAPALIKQEAAAKPDKTIASMTEVLKLFKDTSFTGLHVFTYEGWIENIAGYPGYKIDSASFKDNLRFKGRKIQDPHSALMAIPEIEEYYDVDYHAAWRFPLGNGYKGCIVRVTLPGGPHTINGIWLYVLDTAKSLFVSRVELARRVGEELYFSTAQSWIKDLDRDGVMDVMMRIRNEEAGNTGLSLDLDDTIIAKSMKDRRWAEMQVQDYDSTKKDHPFRQYNVTYP